MNFKKYILIVGGEPNSIFSEIFFKAIKRELKSQLFLFIQKKY